MALSTALMHGKDSCLSFKRKNTNAGGKLKRVQQALVKLPLRGHDTASQIFDSF